MVPQVALAKAVSLSPMRRNALIRTQAAESRANPESARTTIFTLGQRCRMRSTKKANTSANPSAASRLAVRSLATSRCSPQVTYSGR